MGLLPGVQLGAEGGGIGGLALPPTHCGCGSGGPQTAGPGESLLPQHLPPPPPAPAKAHMGISGSRGHICFAPREEQSLSLCHCPEAPVSVTFLSSS